MNEFIEKSKTKRNKKRDRTFYYTNEQMVKDLLSITPYNKNDIILDAGSGLNKVWYNNLKCNTKYECEIEDGNDFYKWNKPVDWIVGNPPFSEGWKFLEKATTIANKGIGFLGNINFWNCLTPKRLEITAKSGFYLSHIHITSDKRWFGRYYYLIFMKQKNNFLSWNRKGY